MFRQMRKKEKSLDYGQINNILSRTKYGILSVIQDNEYPYGIPLNFAHSKNNIYFLSENMGNKKDAIINNNKVSFTVLSPYEEKPDSVVLFGKAREVHSDEKFTAVRLLLEKHSRVNNEALNLNQRAIKDSSNNLAVFKIEIEHRTGKLGD